MIFVESEAKIRRMHAIQGKSIKEIVKTTGIARNTIRKILRESKRQRVYKRTEQPTPKLGDYAETLETWLSQDFKLPRKQRRSAMRCYCQLQALGYEGAYDSVQRAVKAWKQSQGLVNQVYVPLCFEIGEAYQFDWSEEVVELAGVTQKIQVAHFRLSYSRKFIVIAYLRQSQEMLFDAHNKAFAYFGGLCLRGIYDNMKTAVQLVFVGKARKFNEHFLTLMNHYLIEATACNPAAGWEKGQVEKQVNSVRDWFFRPRLKFSSLSELNAHLLIQCQLKAEQRAHPEFKAQTIEAVFREETVKLRALPNLFDAYKSKTVSVGSTCLINFDRNRYSVDCLYAHRTVNVRAYAEYIIIYADDKEIARHPRNFGRSKTRFNPWHYLPLLERKPGALRNGAPFKTWDLPPGILKVKEQLLKRTGGDRECVGILTALLEHGVEAVEVACELALSEHTVSKTVILNILNRLRQEKRPETIETPLSLTLNTEPVANCQHYNQLLKEVNYVCQ